MQYPSTVRQYRWGGIVVAVVLLLIFFLLAHSAFPYVRAAGLLRRMENPHHAGIIGTIHTYPVEESLTEIPTSPGTIRARLYTPKGLANPPGMVIVHGVHHLGIDEPRLVALARAMSASGVRVLTPELLALTDYQIDPHCVNLIGYSTRSFSQSIHQKVGVLGISFGGGLALLAASEPQFERYIRFVLSVGAHDDLERVSQFFVTDNILRPDGTTLHMTAHEYGALILIYSHPEDFFPRTDASAAHEALRLLLWEKVDESKKAAESLSTASRSKLEFLYNHHVEALAGEIEQSLAQHRAEMPAVSPHGHLQMLHVPVMLMHGAADNVVPPSELLWLEHDVPASDLKSALISPVISHASMDGKPTLGDNLRLIRFMAQMLEMLDDRQASPPKPMT